MRFRTVLTLPEVMPTPRQTLVSPMPLQQLFRGGLLQLTIKSNNTYQNYVEGSVGYIFDFDVQVEAVCRNRRYQEVQPG